MGSFEQDIRPLFRPQDVNAMDWAFDLSSYDDVNSIILAGRADLCALGRRSQLASPTQNAFAADFHSWRRCAMSRLRSSSVPPSSTWRSEGSARR